MVINHFCVTWADTWPDVCLWEIFDTAKYIYFLTTNINKNKLRLSGICVASLLSELLKWLQDAAV